MSTPMYRAWPIESRTCPCIGWPVRPGYVQDLGLARLIQILVNRSIYNSKMITDMKIKKSVTFKGCSLRLFN